MTTMSSIASGGVPARLRNWLAERRTPRREPGALAAPQGLNEHLLRDTGLCRMGRGGGLRPAPWL